MPIINPVMSTKEPKTAMNKNTSPKVMLTPPTTNQGLSWENIDRKPSENVIVGDIRAKAKTVQQNAKAIIAWSRFMEKKYRLCLKARIANIL